MVRNSWMIVGALALMAGWLASPAAGQTILTPGTAGSILSNNPPVQCLNNIADYECVPCNSQYGFTVFGPVPNPDFCSIYPDFRADGLSFVTFSTLNYHHYAYDYSPGRPGGGCSPCGGNSLPAGGSKLADLFIQRRHRYRDMTLPSSFGPGVFSNYDVSLTFEPQYVGVYNYATMSEDYSFAWIVEVFDPQETNQRFMCDGVRGDTKDGIYTDCYRVQTESTTHPWLKELRCLDGNGALVTDPNQAVTAVTTNNQGIKYTFDLINLEQQAPTNAVAWWKFDETSGATASDSTGDGNTGTLVNGGTWTTGELGGALQFDGMSTSVSLGNPADLNFQGQITISAWINFQALDGSSTQPILVHGSGDPMADQVVFQAVGNSMSIGATANAGMDSGSASGPISPDDDLGVWVHWAGTYDGKNWNIYRNGILMQTQASDLGSITVTDDWNIGGLQGFMGASYFNGVLDDLRVYNYALSAEEIAYLGQSKLIAGRLKSITDRNGYAVNLTYKSFTPQEILASPDLQRQIDTVTDPYGRQASFSYLPTQVSGRWVVNEINFPNGHKAVYDYANGNLSSVNFDDGTQSTFTYGTDPTTNLTTVQFHDVAAEGSHRDKTVYLTNNMTYNANIDPITSQICNQSSLMVRMVHNGDDEVNFMVFSQYTPQPGQYSPVTLTYYEGAGRLKYIDSNHRSAQFYQDGWTVDQSQQSYPFVGTLEATSAALNHYASIQDWTWISDQAGHAYTYQNDSTMFPTQKGYSDNTTETWTYNQFKQPLRHQDRDGNVTLYAYDANGNLLSKEVGIVNVNGVDTHQPEYGKYQWTYYPSGNANQFLLASSIDANSNTTTYVYDNNHRLTQVIEPPDAPGDAQATTTWTYDTAGRIQQVTDPVNRIVQYVYDERDRVIKIIYGDSSTERFIFGAPGSGNENLLVKQKDRNGVVTKFDYDAAGRCNLTTYAYSTMDLADNETLITDPSVQVTKSCTFLDGTDLIASCTERGETTTYGYDYRQRLVSTTVQPRVGVTLTSTKAYLNNQLFRETDPYGRSEYYGYRSSDGALIRVIQGTVPSFTLADFTAVMNQVRDQTPNAAFLITDYTLDNNGQEMAIIDGRNNTTAQTFDSRGQLAQRVEASGTPVAGTTAWLYDANGNQIEVRTPRYFDSSDPQVGNCHTTLVYTGRNLLKSKTEAPGTSVAATVQYTYNLDRTQATTIDGRNYTWTTLWSPCCAGRVTSQQDPAAGATSTDYDYAGDTTFTQVVQGTTIYNATTTQFDARHRPLFRTVWLTTPPAVDPNNPPIAGQNGVPAADGLTTQWYYDENLADDVGLSSTAGLSIAGVGNVSMKPLLAEIQADGITFGTGSDGYAMLEIKPNGELLVTIQDGAQRAVASGVIQPPTAQNPNQPITWVTFLNDTVATVSSPGNLLETVYIDALDNMIRLRADGAGRTIQSLDAESNVTAFTFDANSNQLSVSDPNSVGYTAVFDARNRETSQTDTMNATTQMAYDANSNVVARVDAKSNGSTAVFDARGRRTSLTDRIGGTSSWGYDSNSNVISLTDSDSNTTHFAFDSRNLKITETYANHNPPSINDQVTFTYDGARRPLTRTDQLGDYVTMVCDMANRPTSRQYRDSTKQPTDPPNDTDSFTYDGSGHLVTAESGRYSNTLTFTYDPAGRRASEALTIGGQTYTVGRGYDAANRLISLSYPDGSVVAQTFTTRNLLQQVSYRNALAASFTYDNGGRRVSRTLGDTPGTTTTVGYVGGGTLAASISTPTLPSLTYTYDVNTNKTAESITGVLQPYGFTTGAAGFDKADRLVAWSRTDGNNNQSWTLSLAGDWQQFDAGATNHVRTNNSVHELVTDNGAQFTYDAKGNMIQNGASLFAFTWDFNNQLAQASQGQSITSFTYDAMGRRVTKQSGGATTVYVSVGMLSRDRLIGQEIAEYVLGAPSGMPSKKYVFGAGTDSVVLMDNGGTPFYYHANAQGSTTAITAADGTLVECYAYSPFGTASILAPDGVTLRNQSAVGNAMLFTGRRGDAETGLYYYRARYYDGGLGRFLSRDPIDFSGGSNLYAYCSNAPLSLTDPDGLAPRKGGGLAWRNSGPPRWVQVGNSWTRTKWVKASSTYRWDWWACKCYEDTFLLQYAKTFTRYELVQDQTRKNPKLQMMEDEAAALRDQADADSKLSSAASWEAVQWGAIGLVTEVFVSGCYYVAITDPVIIPICRILAAMATYAEARALAYQAQSLYYADQAANLNSQANEWDREIAEGLRNGSLKDQTRTISLGKTKVEETPWLPTGGFKVRTREVSRLKCLTGGGRPGDEDTGDY